MMCSELWLIAKELGRNDLSINILETTSKYYSLLGNSNKCKIHKNLFDAIDRIMLPVIQTYNTANKDDIISDVKRVINEYGSTQLKTYKKYGKYSDTVIGHHFGNWTLLLKNVLHIEPKIHLFVTKQELIEDVLKVFHKTRNTGRENYLKHGKYSRSIIKRIFKTWNNLLLELGYSINMHKQGQFSKEDILHEYTTLCKEYGKILTAQEYRKYGSFSQPVIDRVFGGFINLRKELNMEYFVKEYSDDDIKDILTNLYKEYGFISSDLINTKSRTNMATIQNKYGSIEKMCEKFGIEYTLPLSMFQNTVEADISKLLGTNFEREKTFEWLKYKRNLYVDMYYPELNLAIEIDGAQHDRYIPYIHKTYEEYLTMRERDQVKEELLREHGIDTVRIKVCDAKNLIPKLKKYIDTTKLQM